MLLKFKKIAVAAGLLAVMIFLPAGAQADPVFHPTNDGGNLGLGLELGDPGAWGATAKIWIDRVNAFAPAVKFNSGNSAILQLDYLWHNFDVIHLKHTDGEMPLYIGVGGDLLMNSSVQIAARVPLGVSYIFEKKSAPIDIYLQLVPTLWFYTGGAVMNLYPELGAHIYF